MARRDSTAAPPLAVIVVIFTVHEGALQVLLIHRAAAPYSDLWALPGGFLAPDESLDEAAVRKLLDETGLADVFLEQLYTFGELPRGGLPPAIAVAYFALVDYEEAGR